jgi:3-hydroxybutyryl-CoA dehydratase
MTSAVVPAITQFAVGTKVVVERRIVVADIDRFATLSGDTSAIHMDEKAAIARGFSGRVVHGMLLAAWVSAIIGTELPGDCGVLQSANFSFRAPVLPPDVVTITVEITGKSEGVGQLKLAVNIVRSDGVVAMTGDLRSIVR